MALQHIDEPAVLPLNHASDEVTISDPRELRSHRRRRLALAYRLLGSFGWGSLGDGHLTVRDSVRVDHMWVARYGVPMAAVTVDDLVLVGPGPVVVGGSIDEINPAAYNIHWPIHERRPEIAAVAHIHSPWATSLCATRERVMPVSQEACAFFEDHSVFEDEELDVTNIECGYRLSGCLGSNRVVLLGNHGPVTTGATIDEAVGFLLMLERAAEVQLRASGRGKPISAEGALKVKESVGQPLAGWHAFNCAVRRQSVTT